MKKYWNRILPLLLFSTCLTGCLGADAEIYGKDEVLDYVAAVCDEPHILTDQDLVEQTPDRMEYIFEVTGRDLTFTADSYLEPITLDASTIGYSREISCNYVNAVHDLYRDELKQVLKENPHYLPEHGWIYLLSFDDINEVVETILEGDRIWQQELAYHDSTWLKENSITSIHLVYHTSEEEAKEHSNWVNLTDIGITGSHDYEELYEKIAKIYTQKVTDGKIIDPSVPETYQENQHVSTLTSIQLNGVEMEYDNDDNPASSYGLTTEDYKTVWWNEEENSYMILCDIGMIREDMSYPLIIREYVNAQGGEYSVKVTGDRYKSLWTVGTNTYCMDVTYDEGEIQKFKLTQNGEPLGIEFLTYEDDPNVKATFVIGLKVSDFSQILNMTYHIDEATRTLSFSSGGDVL